MSKLNLETENDGQLEGWGARLKALRLAAGYVSQPMLARKTGLAVMTICRHEREQVRPKKDQLLQYCRVYGTTEAYLLYGVGSPHVPQSVERYLDAGKGLDASEETADRLRLMSWSVLGADEPDEKSIDQVRRVIDANILRREKSLDDLDEGVPRLRETLSGKPAGQTMQRTRPRVSA